MRPGGQDQQEGVDGRAAPHVREAQARPSPVRTRADGSGMAVENEVIPRSRFWKSGPVPWLKSESTERLPLAASTLKTAGKAGTELSPESATTTWPRPLTVTPAGRREQRPCSDSRAGNHRAVAGDRVDTHDRLVAGIGDEEVACCRRSRPSGLRGRLRCRGWRRR